MELVLRQARISTRRGSNAGNFGYSRKCRPFRGLEGKDPVSRQEFSRNRTESRESRGGSLLDDFSISEIWKLGRPETGFVSVEKDGKPFGIGGIWENWKDPATGEWIRTFAIITTDANSLVADIHDRMPLILAPEGCARWLGDEPDPGDLMRPFAAELMRMWPITTRVNKPENDDPTIVEPIDLATDAA
jgi:SOS response associated peptidase (SRAP)